MAILGKFAQTTDERKRYVIDWSEWLREGETITDLVFEITPVGNAPVVVDSTIQVPVTTAVIFLSGGDNGGNYKIIVKATTSESQVKEDEIILVVRDL